jgi:hypothetical protein
MTSFKEFVQSQPGKSQAAVNRGAIMTPAAQQQVVGQQQGQQTPKAPGEDDRQPILPIMNVQAGKIDARISTLGYEKAYENMSRACNQILSDEEAMVQVTPEDAEMLGAREPVAPRAKGQPQQTQKGQLVPWEQVYFLSTRNSPRRGYIELEYFQTATKGRMGRMLWSAGWMAKRPLHFPFRLAGEKALGVAMNPEKFYLGQFTRELQRLANQQILYGLNEWDITTSMAGRNIILKPKQGLHEWLIEAQNPYLSERK